MTHDEMLAKLNKDSLTFGEISSAFSALRAVVELHKPFQYDDGAGCYYCVNHIDSNKLYEMYLYPCPTIQAIEKELK